MMTTDKKSIVFMVLHACLFFMVFCLPDFLESSLDTRSGPKINIDKLEKEIHNLVNKERHIKGLSELRWNKTLNAIARMHSKDMIEKNYFSHQSPEGHDFTYRYKTAPKTFPRTTCSIRLFTKTARPFTTGTLKKR